MSHPSNSTQRREGNDPTPFKVLAFFGIIAACSILVGFLIPGGIAMHLGAFYYQPMVSLLERKHPQLIPQLEQFHANQSRIEKAIVSIDDRANLFCGPKR